MPQRALLIYKGPFKTESPSVWGKTKTPNTPDIQRSTLPLTQRACWDRAVKPSPAAAGLTPVGSDLKSIASTYTRRGMQAMWNSYAGYVKQLTSRYVYHNTYMPVPTKLARPSRRFIVGVLSCGYVRVWSNCSAQNHFSALSVYLASSALTPPRLPPICLSCAQVTEQSWQCDGNTHVQTPTEIIPAGCFLFPCQMFVHNYK